MLFTSLKVFLNIKHTHTHIYKDSPRGDRDEIIKVLKGLTVVGRTYAGLRAGK